jgi:hypothetical protein
MRKRSLLLLFFAIIGIQCAIGYAVFMLQPDWTTRGQMGDMFGAANCFFSACAVLGLIYTITLQQHELQLQRQELELTRKELSESAEAQALSANALTAQLREAEKQRLLAAALQQFDCLNEIEFLDSRRAIFSLCSSEELNSTHLHHSSILRFLNYLNHVAYLIAKNFLPEHPILEMFYVTTIRVWITLEPWILKQRQEKGVYLSHLQWLAEKSVDYWTNHHPEATIKVNNISSGASRLIDRNQLFSHLNDIRSTRYEV